MGKVICEICGTVYPDTADACPICGYSRDMTLSDEDLLEEDPGMEPLEGQEEGSSRREIFDFDAVNPEQEEHPEGYQEYEDLGDEDELDDYSGENGGYYDQPRKSNTALIIVLVLIIVALLAATAYLFFTYLLPGKLAEPLPEETTVVTETVLQETTVPTVPCTSLVMTSSGKVELNEKGQFWLIHAKAMPENTTDVLTYTSEDEKVVTVNEEGRVEAVGEGQTNIVLTCGSQKLVCPVTVVYEAAPSEEPAPAPTVEAVPEAQETEAPETEAATEAAEPQESIDPSIELKLKKTDIKFGTRGVSAQLELDCDLKPEQVKWSTSNENIARVDNGLVTTVAPGTAVITAKYGDQEVKCIVRCAF